MYKFRASELEQFRQIWLTTKSYSYLRDEKKKQKISMAKILDNILKEKYDK